MHRIGIALAVALVGCSAVKETGGEIGGTLAEWVACPVDLVDCAHVFKCEAQNENPSGHVELCIDDDDDEDALSRAEKRFGDCAPTPRHQGLCKYCCGDDCSSGCNAYNGCFCD